VSCCCSLVSLLLIALIRTLQQYETRISNSSFIFNTNKQGIFNFVVFFILGDALRLNFMCRRFGTHCSIFIGGVKATSSAAKEQSHLCVCVCVPRTGSSFIYYQQNYTQTPRCTNPRRLVARGDYISYVAPNVCGSSVWILLHVALPEPKVLRWLLDLWEMCAFLYTNIMQRSRWPDYGEGEHYNWIVHTGAMT